MKRIVLGVQYQGTQWQGWQTQPHGQTVQDQLGLALKKFAGTEIATTCAGRTDAGVHALAQVVHFDTNLERPSFSWANGVNAFLPPSIAVRWACELPHSDIETENFHARFSAYARTYHYVVYNNAIRSPLWLHRAGWVFRPIDHERMQEGAHHLLGEHDFSAFRAAECQSKTPIKHLYDIKVQRRGELVIVTLRANAFLHHMVRNIVGSLLQIGSGRRPPEWMGELLRARDRHLAAPTFVPDGLYLAQVDYHSKWNLPVLHGLHGLGLE